MCGHLWLFSNENRNFQAFKLTLRHPKLIEMKTEMSYKHLLFSFNLFHPAQKAAACRELGNVKETSNRKMILLNVNRFEHVRWQNDHNFSANKCYLVKIAVSVKLKP